MWEENQCSICLETFLNSHEVYKVITPCSHPFHNTCLNEFLLRHFENNGVESDFEGEENVKYVSIMPTCPLCRSQIQNVDLPYSTFAHYCYFKKNCIWVTIPDNSRKWFIGPYVDHISNPARDYSHFVSSHDNNTFVSMEIQSQKYPLLTVYEYFPTGILRMSKMIHRMARVVINVNANRVYVLINDVL